MSVDQLPIPGLRDASIPLTVRKCEGCGRRLYGGPCRRRRCPKYSTTWARDVFRVHHAAYETITGPVVMITVTAPGEDRGLRWDRGECQHPRREKCSGEKGCRVVAGFAHNWNRSAPRRWSKLHRRSREAVVRQGMPLNVLSRSWEYQLRGVLHMHVVLPYGSHTEREAARMYAAELVGRAQGHGFGFVDDRLKVRAGGAVAWYLSAYLSKSSKKAPMGSTVTAPDVPDRVFYVRPALMHESGVSMRSRRAQRRVWAADRGLCTYPAAWSEGPVSDRTFFVVRRELRADIFSPYRSYRPKAAT